MSLAERFWAKVDVRGRDECWPWTAYADALGYGKIKDDSGKIIQATHVALILSGKPRPHGTICLHSCDNPPCCNEQHLRWGTNADNARDRDSRGRGVMPVHDENFRRMSSARHTGAKNPSAKLTVDAVQSIRSEPGSQRAIAKKYGVAKSTIARIKNGENWASV